MSIKSYKGFNADMTCKGFKYEEGKEYECEGEIRACDNGFHACERPLDVLAYYPPANSVYHEVEQDGEISHGSDDTKVASSKIKIGARLDIRGLIQAHIEYVKSNTATEHIDEKLATAGNCGAATSRGRSAVGKNGVATVRCERPMVKGGLGAVLVLVEDNDGDYDIKNWRPSGSTARSTRPTSGTRWTKTER